jgi:hypothetical protein
LKAVEGGRGRREWEREWKGEEGRGRVDVQTWQDLDIAGGKGERRMGRARWRRSLHPALAPLVPSPLSLFPFSPSTEFQLVKMKLLSAFAIMN